MQTERMLSIILILMNKKVVTGAELAKHFEVSLRTIYRDIEKIGQTIVPIGSLSGKGGGFYIMENYTLDKTILTNEEIKPFFAIIDSAKAIMGNNPRFSNFIEKFREFYKDKNIEQNSTIDMTSAVNDIDISLYYDMINKGIEGNKTLIFEYINRKLELEEREAEPVKILFERGNWYFIGFCLNRNDYRTFKFSRIKKLQLGIGFIKRDMPVEKIEANIKRNFDQITSRIILKFSRRFTPQLEEYFKKEKITYLEDGTAIVKDAVPLDEGLKKFILNFGVECEVLEPISLRQEMKEYIKKLLDLYNS